YTVMRADNKENINQDVYANDFDLNTLQKEAEKHPKVYGDIRVIDGKLYNHKGWKKVKTVDVADEVVQNPSDIKYIGGRYHVYENGQIVREYIVNGKVEMEAVKRIPESRSQGNLKRDFEGTPLEPVNDIGDFVAKEIAGGNDAVRVITGRDPDTGEKVSDVERAASGTSLTPVGRLLKYGRKGFKFFKGEETAKKVAKVEKSSKGSVKPVSNMNEFFDMEFGKSISNSLSKSKVKYDGQSIYKVEKKTDNPYLKKGYGVYLDALHKDHLEVIDKTGNVKYVLNLDGALNSDKTKKALGRVVKGWK
ncbi:pre-toxin TG domain-containing protein, partial [Bacillus paralicheniformis]